MAMLTIGAYPCPAPIEYSFELNDIDSSNTGLAANGIMNRERIRHGVAKISVKWTMLSTIQANNLLSAVSPASFTVQWRYATSTKTSNMYCKSQSVSCKCIPNTNDYRWEISFNLEEL